jgi:hypothetical protein
MSFKKEDHILSTDQATFLEQKIATKVAEILRHEYEGMASPVKKISLKTGVAPATIKKWYSGQNPPRLAHFLILAQNYPLILQVLLEAIGGPDLWDAFTLLGNKLKTIQAASANLTAQRYSAEKLHYKYRDATANRRQAEQRQVWFLEQMQQGRSLKFCDIVDQWHVSTRTAKSDIALMVKLKLIEFVGAKKNGIYILINPI